MKHSVRTTVDIPAPLYRKLKERAAAQGRSFRELVIAGVQASLARKRRPARRLKFLLLFPRAQEWII